MCRPASANKIRVLIGEKLHRDLYPSRDALLAEARGMSVTIARLEWTAVKIRWVGDFLAFIFISF